MKKAFSLILIVIMLMFTMSGCDDAREISTWIYTYVIGVDKGVTDKLRFTIMIPTLGAKPQDTGSGSSGSGSSGSESAGSNVSTITIDCPTIISGVNLMNSFLSRRVNYSHAKFFIIGEELAKAGIEPFMQGMRMTYQIRLNMHVIVAKGEAANFIEKFKPTVGLSIPRTMDGLLEAVSITGIIDDHTYMEVMQDLKSTKRHASCILGAVNDQKNLLPAGSDAQNKLVSEVKPGELARKGGDPIELIGAAVFKGDKLVGELNLGETRSIMMVEGQYATGAFTLPDPMDEGSFVSIQFHKQKEPQKKVKVNGEKPVIDIEVFYEGTIQNQQNDIKYHTPEFKAILVKAYEDFMVKSISETIKKCQELGCDVVGFGEIASMSFLTIQDWEKYGWFDKFKDAQVNVKANLIIRRTGVIVEYNEIKGE